MGTPPNIAARLSGFSLVEVLIALIIVSVGMLGIAGLYVQSLQAGRNTLYRHNAVTLAGDIADRIRANPGAGQAYATAEPSDYGCFPDGQVRGNLCSATQMAANDIMLWNQQAADSLPQGAYVDVQFSSAVLPPLYTITIHWQEPGMATPPSYAIDVPVLDL